MVISECKSLTKENGDKVLIESSFGKVISSINAMLNFTISEYVLDLKKNFSSPF